LHLDIEGADLELIKYQNGNETIGISLQDLQGHQKNIETASDVLLFKKLVHQ